MLITKERDRLQFKADRLASKAESKGWSSEKLASRIGNVSQRIDGVNGSLGTMSIMEGSSQVYALSKISTGELGGLTLNTSNNVINISFGSTANFVHEITHAGQFESRWGHIAFEGNTGNVVGQDIYDEVQAYRAQYAYSPSSVTGLASNSTINSVQGILPAWVQGIRESNGNTPYASGRSANTGLIPIYINSTRDSFIQAYPWNAAAFRGLPANYSLKSLPGIYYKR